MEERLREFGQLIGRVANGYGMSREESCEAYRQVVLNEQPELQQGAFLMAHISRKPTTEELAGAWDALDRYDTAKISYRGTQPVCDIVGTGSDALKTVNCSSPAALIAAAAGLTVAKKGARLVTGVSGASDIFENWGIHLDAPLEAAEQALAACDICYLPGEAFLRQGWARLIRSMRFSSAFNIIGPITRPCQETSHMVMGAYAPSVCDQLIGLLREIDIKAALAPYGMVRGIAAERGMDEFSPCGPTRVTELRNGRIETYEVTPEDFGCAVREFDPVASRASARENAAAILRVLRSEPEGPLADFFCMNAGAALYITDKAPDYRIGTEMAREALAAGKAVQKLNALRRYQGKDESRCIH